MVFEIVEAFICVANFPYISVLIIYYNLCLALMRHAPRPDEARASPCA